MNAGTDDDADDGARQPHDGGLGDVDRQHLPTRRTEAAQNRRRFDLARDEGRDPAGDADPAQQQRDDAEYAEKIRQSSNRAGEVGFGVGNGLNPHALRSQFVPLPREPAGRDRSRARGQRDQRLVVGACARDQQPGGAQISVGDKDARADCRGDTGVAGNGADGADDLESGVAERE